MTKKYEIILRYIKDLSVEIPNLESFLLSREYITKYSLGLNITTNPIKNEMLEIITKLNYKDPNNNSKKSFFEIHYASVIRLNDKNCTSVFIPPGFAHGFYTLKKENIVCYSLTEYRSSKDERSLKYNDPKLKIKWPTKKPNVSKKDKVANSFDLIDK